MNVTHQRKAEIFHTANPQVFAELAKIALDVRRRGHTRFGIRTIWERLRWIATFKTDALGDPYKLNDHYHAFYARLLMQEYPELEGFFELRERRVKEDLV